jgi:hypothetical protein
MGPSGSGKSTLMHLQRSAAGAAGNLAAHLQQPAAPGHPEPRSAAQDGTGSWLRLHWSGAVPRGGGGSRVRTEARRTPRRGCDHDLAPPRSTGRSHS